MHLKLARETALNKIVDLLERDGRFEAAWLAGSFGRGEEDAYSDLDLTIVVDEQHAPQLCERHRATGAGTVAARFEIVSAIDEPAIVHEHHANAPRDGSFTAVVYGSGIAVDWTFIPADGATRPASSRLLFDNIDVPKVETRGGMDEETAVDRLAERYAYFWLLAVPAAKSCRREDGVKFHAILEMMFGAKREIESLLNGVPPAYTRHSLAPFCPTSEEQHRALLVVCDAVAGLAPQLRAAGASVLEAPERVLAAWLTL